MTQLRNKLIYGVHEVIQVFRLGKEGQRLRAGPDF